MEHELLTAVDSEKWVPSELWVRVQKPATKINGGSISGGLGGGAGRVSLTGVSVAKPQQRAVKVWILIYEI